MKDWECVEIKHHKDVGKTIKEWEKNGWRLHTYSAAGMGTGPLSYIVNHYLLFEKESFVERLGFGTSSKDGSSNK